MSFRPRSYLKLLAVTAPGVWVAFRLTKAPLIGPLVERILLPLWSGDNFNVTYVPVREGVEVGESAVLPRRVVEELIRRSSHRMIIDRCTCRDARKCPNHPVTLGCTLLGEGAREIDSRLGRHASVDEALRHLDRAVAEGLIPLVGRVRIDNLIWGVKNRGRLLTVCYCCPCCCVFLTSGTAMPEATVGSLVRLKGLRVEVDPERCDACGTCVEECFVAALSLREGTASSLGERPREPLELRGGVEGKPDRTVSWDGERCKGCGRCAEVCPRGAPRLSIEDMDAALEEVIGRIRDLIYFE